MNRWLRISACLIAACAHPAIAQQSAISLGGEAHDTLAPLNVTADNLSLDQEAQQATFSGNAKVTQGDLALTADKIEVTYSEDTGDIVAVFATGNVIFTRQADSAKADTAKYTVEDSQLILSGNVTLEQGSTIVSGDRLDFNVETNLAKISGNVRTQFKPN